MNTEFISRNAKKHKGTVIGSASGAGLTALMLWLGPEIKEMSENARQVPHLKERIDSLQKQVDDKTRELWVAIGEDRREITATKIQIERNRR